jgi:hypothetical protein
MSRQMTSPEKSSAVAVSPDSSAARRKTRSQLSPKVAWNSWILRVSAVSAAWSASADRFAICPSR